MRVANSFFLICDVIVPAKQAVISLECHHKHKRATFHLYGIRVVFVSSLNDESELRTPTANSNRLSMLKWSSHHGSKRVQAWLVVVTCVKLEGIRWYFEEASASWELIVRLWLSHDRSAVIHDNIEVTYMERIKCIANRLVVGLKRSWLRGYLPKINHNDD